MDILLNLPKDAEEKNQKSDRQYWEHDESSNPREGSIGLNKRDILIVQSTPDMAHLYETALTARKLSVESVNTGGSALNWLNKNDPPNIILLEIILTDMSGFCLIRKIHELFAHLKIKTVMTSGLDDVDMTKYIVLPDSYIKLPVSLSKLYSEINYLLGDQPRSLD